jgi:hypothetical protein
LGELYYKTQRSTSLPEKLEAISDEEVDADKIAINISLSNVEKANKEMRDKKGSSYCPQMLGERWSQPNDTTDQKRR